MKSTIQAMFYACDYSTKPNMTCAPLLVAVRDGIGKLEDQFRREDEEARNAELRGSLEPKLDADGNSASFSKMRRPLTKQEDEARRRLIRQATAANQAVVKGNCLMALQILTGREVLRSHYPWQLMMKTPMWMAFQCRRELQGFDERKREDEVLLNAAVVGTSSDEDEERDGDEDFADVGLCPVDAAAPGSEDDRESPMVEARDASTSDKLAFKVGTS